MNTSKRAVYYQQAEDLYVQNGFSLQMIEDIFQNKVTRRTISNWKNEFDWDTKKKKYLVNTQTMIEEIKEVVKLAIEKAKIDPSMKNLGAAKRAVDILKSLEAINLFKPPEGNKNSGLTQDKALEIRKEILGF